MKISHYIFAAILLVSCGSSKPLIGVAEGDDAKSNDLLTSGVASVKLFSKDKSDTALSLVAYNYYTNPVLPYQDSVNLRVKQYIYGNLSSLGFDADRNSTLSRDIIRKGLDSFASMYYAELSLYGEEEYFGGIWSVEIGTDITEKKEYVEVSMNGWQYTGGAHGSSWSEDALFDRKTGQRLFLSDFISDVGALTAIAEEIFRKDLGMEPNEDLQDAGFWFENSTFLLNENFSFNSESLEIVYNQYEIAPYAAGIIVVSIPLDKIKSLLKRRVD